MLDIAIIFRSIINFKDAAGQETISQPNLVKNFRALQEHVPDPPEEKAYQILYHYILDHVRTCDTSDDYELPSYELIKKWFEENGDKEVEAILSVLEKIRVQQPYIGQDYRKILKQYKQEVDLLKLEQILVTAEKIAKIGLRESKAKNAPLLKGIPDAIDYFARQSRYLRQNVFGLKLESQIVSQEDVTEMKTDYEKVKKDPIEVLGIYTGLDSIDTVCKGLKNTELMLVTAFTSHGKTTFVMHVAYKAIISGFNSAVITLEQSFKEIRQQIYVKHTCNPKFSQEPYSIKHPEFSKYIGNIALEDIIYGNLDEKEQAFFDAVCTDLIETPGYGKLYLWQPPKAQITVADIEFKLMQIQQELKATGRDLEFAVIDYISLLGLPVEERTKDPNENQNTIIKQLKRMCLTFNNGKGIRILSPFQASRKGYEEAIEHDGIYSLTALSNAHEAERSSDVVIALFVDKDGRNEGKTKFSCLKNRRHRFFNPFNAILSHKSFTYTESNFDPGLEAVAAAEQIQSII
jgi:replicative DNA helicase